MRLSFLPILMMVVLWQSLQGQAIIQKGADIDGETAVDYSGWSLSMPDPQTLAVGGPWNNGGGSNSGHVRVYKWSGSAWVQKGTDIDGDGVDDLSGYSLSMPDSETVAIGAFRNDDIGNDAGQVRVYEWSGSSWVQKGADINGEAAEDLFGHSVSMPNANTIAIGGHRNDGNGSASGHVRVFTWNGSAWVQKGTDIDGEIALCLSGWAVSMGNVNTVAIGAPLNGGNGNQSGHVRVYSWNGSTWVQKGADIDGEAVNDKSGYSVSMPNANTVAIGAELNDGNGIDAGHVRVYAWNGSYWMQKGTDINGEAADDYSGHSVSMPDVNTVAIGGHRNDGNGSNSGHVRVYQWSGSTWAQKGGDINGESAEDLSGYAVSMPDAYNVAIGAIANYGSSTYSGHARVFSICADATSAISPTACGSYTSPSTNYTWTTSGTYVDVIPTTAGCDSIITINLTINNSSADTISPSVCESYVSPSANYTWTSSGTYTDTIPNASGCDSIVTVILSIDTVDITLSNTSQTLTANATVASYQWLDCDSSYSLLPGETSQSFTPIYTGNYAVEITESGCIDTSACEAIVIASVVENDFNLMPTLFPNPTSGNLTINLGQLYPEITVIIRDALGQETSIGEYLSINHIELEMNVTTGVYFIEISSATDNRRGVWKVFKE